MADILSGLVSSVNKLADRVSEQVREHSLFARISNDGLLDKQTPSFSADPGGRTLSSRSKLAAEGVESDEGSADGLL